MLSRKMSDESRKQLAILCINWTVCFELKAINMTDKARGKVNIYISQQHLAFKTILCMLKTRTQSESVKTME